MSILSVNFLVFVLISAVLYYLCPGKGRPYVLFFVSAFFLALFGLENFLYLLFCALFTYLFGRILSKRPSKALLAAYLSVLFLVLIFVKFSPYVSGLLSDLVGTAPPSFFTDVFVPVGISFYALRMASYCIDVCHGKYKATGDIVLFLSYAFFFPLFLQGPVQSFDTLRDALWDTAPKKKIYHNVTYGAQLMLWGFFQKLVIAERAGLFVDEVFSDASQYSAGTLALAALLYSVQIFTDFSGCVDICRGAAQTFGIDVMQNFNLPYFSESVAEFWRRWHISLSTWLKNYIYIPLGGSRKGKVRKYCNVLIVFLVSGLWHGVGVHFLVWGLLHGLYQVIGGLTKPLRDKCYALLRLDPGHAVFVWTRRILTFLLVTVGWVFFRAETTADAFSFLGGILSGQSAVLLPKALDTPDAAVLLFSVIFLFFVSYYRLRGVAMRDTAARLPIPVRWAIYLSLFLAVVIFGIYGPGYSASGFIYMNF